MTSFVADPTAALSFSLARLKEPRIMNPAWLPRIDAAALAPSSLDAAQQRIVDRALIAPTVLALSVTTASERREVTVVVDREGAITLTPDAEGTYRWEEIEVAQTAALLEAQLPADTPLAAPPQMTARSESTRLPLSPEQQQAIAARRESGVRAQDAIAAQEDLSPLLRDALLSDGDRAVLDISLHVPAEGGEAPPLLFHLLRHWTVGAHGLYAADGDEPIATAIHRVEGGDVLATMLPLLAEGVQLARGEAVAA
ncbi:MULTISPECIES: hypothetical protein [unclassified Brachybacterium]|uniref:hypothetical protein n=1 Tax=unclassified Brachybacterium TaxID=2623841 RepID=UPI000C806784|nr:MULTISPECIES: hypothetical protein [unclassified Brachybacterium]PMC75081.1 hypothetical protein CJ197_10245 [Brachybacterium sp. UMB0905]